MTVAELEKRVTALERTIKQLAGEHGPHGPTRWWVESAGQFADDRAFDEIVRLGRQ